MPRLGIWEILIIILIIVLIFGARKIPELGRGLGEGIRNFRKALRGDTEDKDKTEERKETKNN
ncbi:MAG: twin-arginine translocase TatA/TatE family subunit [Acidobacteriota bacterium]